MCLYCRKYFAPRTRVAQTRKGEERKKEEKEKNASALTRHGKFFRFPSFCFLSFLLRSFFFYQSHWRITASVARGAGPSTRSWLTRLVNERPVCAGLEIRHGTVAFRNHHLGVRPVPISFMLSSKFLRSCSSLHVLFHPHPVKVLSVDCRVSCSIAVVELLSS